MNDFLYLPAQGRIESAIPISQIMRVDYHRPRKPQAETFEVQFIDGHRMELVEPPYTKQLLYPVGWERWSLNAMSDCDQEHQPLLCLWTASPVMSLVQCSPMFSGSAWFEDVSSHGDYETGTPSLLVDVKRGACWSDGLGDWDIDLAQHLKAMLTSLKHKHPELVVSGPPWLETVAPGEDQALRKTGAA